MAKIKFNSSTLTMVFILLNDYTDKKHITYKSEYLEDL